MELDSTKILTETVNIKTILSQLIQHLFTGLTKKIQNNLGLRSKFIKLMRNNTELSGKDQVNFQGFTKIEVFGVVKEYLQKFQGKEL